MKKNFKQWLALVLAVVLVSGTCLTHTDSFLWATEGETTEATNENVQTVAEGTGETAEQQTVEQQQPVEEKQEVVIPKKEEKPTPAPAEQEKKEEPKVEEPANKEQPKAEEPAKETQPENKTEANQTVQGTKPAGESAGGQEVEVVPSDKKENFYNVVFHKPAVDGGTLYVWEDGKSKQEASYNNGKFTKEVKEGTTLYFEIKAADNYSVEKVTDKSGRVMTPEKATENTSTYKMVVKEQNDITIVYKEVKVEEPKTEEQPKEEPQVEEPQKNEATETPTEGDEVQDPVTEEEPGAGDETTTKKPLRAPLASDTPNAIADNASTYAITGENKVVVGKTITLKDDEGAEWYQQDKWESSNSKIATVVGNEKEATVTGVSAGTVTITHSWGSFRPQKNTFQVTVVNPVIATSVQILLNDEDVTDIMMTAGENDKILKAKVLPEDADQTVTWKSSDEGVVSVQDGKLTATKVGEAKITATTSNGKEDTVNVTVGYAKAESISIKPEKTGKLYVDGTLKLNATIEPETAQQEIIWSSTQSEIAEVDDNGLVKAKSVGVTTIRAAVKSNLKIYAEYQVTVDEKPEGLIVTQKKSDDENWSDEVTIPVGEIENTISSVEAPQDYRFEYAKVGNTKIYSIEKSGNQIYVTTAPNQLSGILVEDSKEIVLYYVPDVASYQVTYQVTVNGKNIPVNANGEAKEGDILHTKIIGVREVNEGSDLKFSVAEKDGYTIEKVTANGKAVQRLDGIYTVENVSGDTNIQVTLEKETTNQIGFHGSILDLLLMGRITTLIVRDLQIG